jgi:Pyruvate/2-oxoacid:ferredoxin oxidoreductase delta subunit
MAAKVLRKIIRIDEAACNGCGECISSCAEGALALVDGKARLVKEKYCDGLAACLKQCPQGALTIVEREADSFDEAAAVRHVGKKAAEERLTPCACSGSAVRQLAPTTAEAKSPPGSRQESRLSHWPVQLALVPSGAKFLAGSDVVLVADCVPFAYPDLHADFLQDHSVLVACPKLDDADAHMVKLAEIFKKSDIRSLTILHMEVPCCSGLVNITRKALEFSGKTIPVREVTINITGEIKSTCSFSSR